MPHALGELVLRDTSQKTFYKQDPRGAWYSSYAESLSQKKRRGLAIARAEQGTHMVRARGLPILWLHAPVERQCPMRHAIGAHGGL